MGDRDLNKQTSLDYGHRTALITTATLPPRPRDQQLSKFHTFTNIFPAFITLFDDSNTAAMPSEYCPVYAPFFGAMGCTCAIVFTCLGASYGTAKSGVGIAAMGVLRPDLIVKKIVPVIMAGLAAGFAIGIVGDAGVRGTAQQPRLFVGMILI